jgi:CheY-like chemotaxis protein
MPFKVAFLGFTDFERSALTSYFRLALTRTPSYLQVATLTDADFLVADADHGPSVQLVVATERLGETVFVGAQAPAGSRAWMMRPIDALQVMRELDAMTTASGATPPSVTDSSRHTTVIQPPRRTKVEMAGELLAAAPPAPAPAVPELAAAPVVPPEPAPPVAAQSRPVAPPPPPSTPPAPAAPPRALLVDDSDVARRYLQTRLARWRLDVEHAATSQEAVDLLGQCAYDFVFLDIDLGEESELDGLALCQRIKQSPEWMQAAVIMVSVHHSELDRVRGALAGCDGYLRKPLDEVELQRLMLRQGLKVPKDAGLAQT